MYSFSKTKAFKKLTELAKKPFDLTAENALSEERIMTYLAKGPEFILNYATERVDESTLEALLELSLEAQALKKMECCQAGDVLNKIEGYESESRSVLHTATRDFFEDPKTEVAALNAATFSKNELGKLEKFIQFVSEDKKYTDFILIGIGGSELGPKANYQALRYLQKPGLNIFFLANVDPDDAAEIIKKCNLKKCLVAVVSKSGNTLETLTNELFVKRYFIEAGLDPKEHFVAITSPKSEMDDKDKYLEVFYLLDSVGGRYSSTSMVGGLLLAFAFGFEVFVQFLKGANAMDKAALKKDLKENIPLLGALLGIWNRNFLHYATLAIIPYSHALDRFPAHIQQLDMESNGKHIDRFGHSVDFKTGPIIWGEPGTNAQHSFYQLIHQGTDVIPLEFIGFRKSQSGLDIEVQETTSQEKLLANLYAQIIAFATGQKNDNPNKEFKGNRPSHLLLGEQLTPHALGSLLSYYENLVAFQGFIWNINSFDQEGVQLGKVLANKIIDRFKSKKNNKTYPPFLLGDAYLKL